MIWGGLVVLTFFLTQYGTTKGYSVFHSMFNRKGLVVYCVFSVCFSLLYISNMLFLRLLAFSYTFITYSIFLCYQKINNLGNSSFGIWDANVIYSDSDRSGVISDVMLVYWKPIIYGVVESLACVFIIYFLARLIKFRIQRAIVSVGPIMVISIAYFLIGSGAAVDMMPIVEKVPMQLSFARKLNVYRGEREPVKLSLIQKKQFPVIIYIVDESIRGDLLGINGFKFDTTPFLAGYKGTLLNYGVAVSSGNCSAPSHIFLQTGVLPKSDSLAKIDHELFSKPNIFQYAQHAGYRTIFVEGQLKGDKLQNFGVDADADATEAARLMRENAIRRLPVTEDGQVAGMVSLGDLALQDDPASALAGVSQAAANVLRAAQHARRDHRRRHHGTAGSRCPRRAARSPMPSARRHPDVITTEQRKDKREMRIYADVMRNAYAQTVAASYGVRARPGAPVATPLSWAEVADDALEPGRFTMATVRARLDSGDEPWADFDAWRHQLGAAENRLAKLEV